MRDLQSSYGPVATKPMSTQEKATFIRLGNFIVLFNAPLSSWHCAGSGESGPIPCSSSQMKEYEWNFFACSGQSVSSLGVSVLPALEIRQKCQHSSHLGLEAMEGSGSFHTSWNCRHTEYEGKGL